MCPGKYDKDERGDTLHDTGKCCETLMNMKRMRGRNHRPGGGSGGGSGGGGGGGSRNYNGNVPLNRNHVFDSSGPDLRIRGTAQQLFEKYLQLGRDATGSGDRVLAESYFQYAEHYFRILNAIAQATQQTAPQQYQNAQNSQGNQGGGYYNGQRRPQDEAEGDEQQPQMSNGHGEQPGAEQREIAIEAAPEG
jgi:hypothetical protein